MADIKLSSRRCEESKKIVVEMFVKYGVCCVPINGFEIASKMGVTVIPYSAFPPQKRALLLKKSEDGFLLKKPQESGISTTTMKKVIAVLTTPLCTRLVTSCLIIQKIVNLQKRK